MKDGTKVDVLNAGQHRKLGDVDVDRVSEVGQSEEDGWHSECRGVIYNGYVEIDLEEAR